MSFCGTCGGAYDSTAGDCVHCQPNEQLGRQLFRLAPERFTLTIPELQASVSAGAAVLGICVAGLTCVVAAVTLALAPAGALGSLDQWFRVAVMVLGLTVHGRVHATASGNIDMLFFSVGADAGVWASMTSVTVLSVLLGLSVVTGRRLQRASMMIEPFRVLSAAAVSGLSFAVLLAALALASTGVVAGIADAGIAVRIGLGAWSALPGGVLIAAVGIGFGRLSVLPPVQAAGGFPRWLTGALGGWREPMRTTRDLLVVTVAVAVQSAGTAIVLAMILSGVDLSKGDGTGDFQTVVGLIGAGLLVLPNLVLVGSGFVTGGAVGAGGSAAGSSAPGLDGLDRGLSASGTVGLLSGGVPGWTYLVLVPMTLAVVGVGGWAAMRNSRDASAYQLFGRVSLCLVGTWLVLLPLTRVSFGFRATGGTGAIEIVDAHGSGFIGLSIVSTLVGAVIWSAVCAWGGAAALRLIAPSIPAHLLRLGGAGIHPEWRAVLTATALQRGQEVELPLDQGPLPPGLSSSRNQRRVLLALVGGLALVVAAVVGQQVLARTVFGPAAEVRAFAAALGDHNASRALEHVAHGSLADLDRTLVTDDALDRPATLRVDAVRIDGDTASVDVVETVSGADRTVTLRLVREGRQALLWSGWKVTAPFGRLTISADDARGGAAVTANGVGLTVGSYPVLPGKYLVESPGHGMLAKASAEATVFGGGDDDEVVLEATLDPAARTVAESAVLRYLAECAKSSAAAPTGCPFGYSSFGTVSHVSWTITQQPKFSIDLNSAGAVVVSTESPGTAHLTGRSTDWFGTSEPVSDDESFDVDGSVTWEGDDPATAVFTRSGW